MFDKCQNAELILKTNYAKEYCNYNSNRTNKNLTFYSNHRLKCLRITFFSYLFIVYLRTLCESLFFNWSQFERCQCCCCRQYVYRASVRWLGSFMNLFTPERRPRSSCRCTCMKWWYIGGRGATTIRIVFIKRWNYFNWYSYISNRTGDQFVIWLSLWFVYRLNTHDMDCHIYSTV